MVRHSLNCTRAHPQGTETCCTSVLYLGPACTIDPDLASFNTHTTDNTHDIGSASLVGLLVSQEPQLMPSKPETKRPPSDSALKTTTWGARLALLTLIA